MLKLLLVWLAERNRETGAAAAGPPPPNDLSALLLDLSLCPAEEAQSMLKKVYAVELTCRFLRDARLLDPETQELAMDSQQLCAFLMQHRVDWNQPDDVGERRGD